MEAVLRVVWALRGRQARVSVEEALAGASSAGLSQGLAAWALENWAAIGAWRIHGDHVWLTQGAIDAGIEQMLTAAEAGVEVSEAGLARNKV
eukprot:5540144-Lingulodinium_polyedra.AAC.1